MFNRIKTPAEIAAMREGGRMLATILQIMKKQAVEGVTPKHLAQVAKQELKAFGADSPFLGYEGYPDVICISVNDQVQHAIPDDRPLQGGDVVNFDFGVKYKGMITDAGLTTGLGKLTVDNERLLRGTEQALAAAIAQVRAGVRIGTISHAIEEVLISHKLGIVRELAGHGVGHELHEDPDILNYGRPNTGPTLQAGMTIAIEPITTLGRESIYIDRADGWTIYTVDGSNSAQFEHTLLVTDDGVEILTKV